MPKGRKRARGRMPSVQSQPNSNLQLPIQHQVDSQLQTNPQVQTCSQRQPGSQFHSHAESQSNLQPHSHSQPQLHSHSQPKPHSLSHSQSHSQSTSQTQSTSQPLSQSQSQSQSSSSLEDNLSEHDNDSINDHTDTQPQSSHGEVPSSVQSTTRRGRGPARLDAVWGTEKKLHVELNRFLMPVGPNATKFITQLGIIAKDGNRLPLTYVTWRVKDLLPFKKRVWLEVQENTDVPNNFQVNCMKKLGRLWKEWKGEAKKQGYRPFKTDEERLANRPPRVEEDQWPILVQYWNSHAAKKTSRQNRRNRSKQKTFHTSGRTSHFCVEEEMRRQNKALPSSYDLWLKTHTKKDGTPVDEVAATKKASVEERLSQLPPESAKSVEIRNQIFYEVLGPDSHGRARVYGSGPSPTEVLDRQERERVQSQFTDEVRQEWEDGLLKKLEQRFANVEATLEIIRTHFTSSQSGASPVAPTVASGSQQDLESSRSQQRFSQVSPLQPQPPPATTVPSSHPLNPSHESQNLRRKKKQKASSNKGEKKVDLVSFSLPKKVVAKGVIVSKDPLKEVWGIPLGMDFWEVYVKEIVNPEERLIRSCGNKHTVGATLRKNVAWRCLDVMTDDADDLV